MKKFDSVKSLKIFAAIALAIIVAGAFILGFFGYNRDVRSAAHCEVKVSAEENFGDVNENMTAAAEAAFAEYGLKYVYKETMDDGRAVLYLFKGENSVSDEAVASLQSRLDESFSSSTVEVTAARYGAEGYADLGEMWWALLAAGILFVVAFFYMALRYKWAAAFAFAITAAGGTALAAMLCALTRVVITPAFLAVMAAAFAFSAVFALYFANVVWEDKKNVANESASAAAIVSGAFREVFLKTLATFVAAVILAAGLLLLAPVGAKYAAVQFIVCLACAAAFALFGYGGLYAVFAKKNQKK